MTMICCGVVLQGIRRIPVVKSPGGDLVNIITQSALVQTLSANLSRFEASAFVPSSAHLGPPSPLMRVLGALAATERGWQDAA